MSELDKKIEKWLGKNWEVTSDSKGYALTHRISFEGNETGEISGIIDQIKKMFLDTWIIEQELGWLRDEIETLKESLEAVSKYKTYYELAYDLAHGPIYVQPSSGVE